jgi:hypothetical protein
MKKLKIMIDGTLYIDNFIDNDSFLFNTLRSGSLFYTTADVQDLWVHSIPVDNTVDGRMSLTFRSLI